MSSSSIQQFQHEQFGTIRTTIIDNEPWFVASDVAKALGYRMASDMARRLDDDEKDTRSVRTLGGNQNMTVINESGLYNAILGSKIESAKAFRKWVTSDVLPSIRKHGMYATAQTVDEMLADPDTMIRTLVALKAERAKVIQLEADKQTLVDDNAHMLPKAVAYDSFIEGEGTYSLTSAARLLAQMDKTINRKRLTALLRADEMLCKASRCPTKKAIDRGYAKQMIAKKASGEAAEPYAHLTQKGLDWCIRNYVSMPTNKSVPINAQVTTA